MIPLNQYSRRRNKCHLLELLIYYTNLFGPVEPVNLSGKKYTLVVVDDYSRYTWVIFLRKKKKTLVKMLELLRVIQNEQNQKIVKIKSDRGTEFVNSIITKYCNES